MKKLLIHSGEASQAPRAQTPRQQARQQDPIAPRVQPFANLPDDLLMKIVEQLKPRVPAIQFARDVHSFSLASRRCKVAATRYGGWDDSLGRLRDVAIALRGDQHALAVETAALKGVFGFTIDDQAPKSLVQIFETHAFVRIDVPPLSFSCAWAALEKWADQLRIRRIELNALLTPNIPSFTPSEFFEIRLARLDRMLAVLERHPDRADITVAVVLMGPGGIIRPRPAHARFVTSVIESDIVTSLRLQAYPGLSVLVRAVPTARVLTALDLRGNDIGAHGSKVCAQMIVGMIQRSKTLKTLDLRDNPIPVEGKQALLVTARESGVTLLLD